tara:strand:+ start:610 stop:813 length:204 start_codon:yes stop_codon:yes gene_type:complete
MANKSKSSGNVSNGVHSNVSKKTRKAVRRSRSELEKAINKMDAWRRGKKVNGMDGITKHWLNPFTIK